MPRRPLTLAARAIDQASLRVAQATLALSLVLSVGFILCLLLQIFFRYVLNAPLTWTGELAVFQFLWVVMLLASVGVREDFHVRLTLLTGGLPERPRDALERAVTAAVVGFGVYMVIAGVRFVDLTWGSTSAAIRYPLQALYLAAPVCGAAIVLHGLARLLAPRRLAPQGGGSGVPNVNGAGAAGGAERP